MHMHELHEAGQAQLSLFISASVHNSLAGAGLVARFYQADITTIAMPSIPTFEFVKNSNSGRLIVAKAVLQAS